MCSEHCNLPDVSFVSIDDVYSSQIAVNYLLSIGRSRIALINSQLTNAYARFRERAFSPPCARPVCRQIAIGSCILQKLILTLPSL